MVGSRVAHAIHFTLDAILTGSYKAAGRTPLNVLFAPLFPVILTSLITFSVFQSSIFVVFKVRSRLAQACLGFHRSVDTIYKSNHNIYLV